MSGLTIASGLSRQQAGGETFCLSVHVSELIRWKIAVKTDSGKGVLGSRRLGGGTEGWTVELSLPGVFEFTERLK
jgi:hypothetical protein